MRRFCREGAFSASSHQLRQASFLPASQVFSFGSGIQGALGFGTEEDEYEPEAVQIQADIDYIGSGHYHSFAVTQEGKLWSWGRCKEHQLGRYLEGHDANSKPGEVSGFGNAKVTCATGSGVASFACTSEGDLYAWGTSKRGQLGLSTQIPHASTPTRLCGLQDIHQVSAGWGHALALNGLDEVFSWGFPQHGRLGHSFAVSESQDDETQVMRRCVWEARKIDALSGLAIKQVACGFDFSLALACDGRLFSFGDNSLGQLARGLEASSSEDSEEWIVKDPDGRPFLIDEISAGLSHCVATTTEGDLLTWGWNSAGQLGIGDDDSNSIAAVPQRALRLQSSSSTLLAAGRVHTIHSSGSSTSACGSGRHGRLGLGSQANASVFTHIDALEERCLHGLACGLDHTLVLASDT